MNLQETVQEQLNGLIDNGTIKEIIRKQLEKTVTDIISDSLRSYSDFGKELGEVIKGAMKINFDKISSFGYQKIVTDIVKEELQKKLLTDIQEPLIERLDDVLGGFSKGNYKLSNIVHDYMHQEKRDDEGELSFYIEHSSYGYTHVAFDIESDKSRYDCEIQFDVNKEGKIYSFQIGGYNKHQGNILKKSIHGSVETLIFNIYASQSTIEIDENACETEWYYD